MDMEKMKEAADDKIKKLEDELKKVSLKCFDKNVTLKQIGELFVVSIISIGKIYNT